MSEVYRVVAENVGDEQTESARLVGADVGRVVAEADAEERPTGARTALDAAAGAGAARRSRAAVAVRRSTAVVAVAPQTQLKLARSADLDDVTDIHTTNG